MKLARAGIAVLGVLAVCPFPMSAGLIPTWQQSLSVTVPEHGSIPLRARELSDGSILLLSAGTAVRYDNNGQVLSTAVFSPPRFVPEGSFPIVVSVSAIHADGRVFVASTSDQGFATSHSDIWISAFDGRTGGELWGSPSILPGPKPGINTPAEILILADGNLAVIAIESGNGLANVLISKVDSTTGNVLWGPLVLGSSISPLAAVDVSGDLIVAAQKGDGAFLGKIRALDGTFAWGPVDLAGAGGVSALEPAPDGGVFLSRRRFDGFDVWKRSGADGGVVWGPTRVTDSTAAVTGIAATPAGDAVVSGWTGDHAFLLLLRGATGEVAWGPVSQPASRSTTTGITVGVTPAGDVAVSGWISAPPAFPELNTWKYSGSTGSLLWGPLPIAGALFHSTPTVLSVRSDGSLFEGAEIAAGLIGLQRNSSTGAVLWGPTGFSTTRAAVPRAVDVTQGADGSVYVTGYLPPNSGGSRWVTIRYARSSGAAVWGPVFFDSDNPNGPFTVRVDSAGNAFVLGATVAGATLVKYAAADGALVWSTHPDPAPDPRSLAIDAAGNPILLDRHIVLSGPYELSTVKVSGATGSVLWGPVRHQRAGGDTFATSVSITPTGDVVSGGYVFRDPGQANEWEVVEYSGATGTVLWTSTLFTGPVFGSQGAASILRDLAADPFGDVLLEGDAYDGNGTASMTVAKLNGATGVPLWGPVFSAGTDFGAAVAVDSHGDVFATGQGAGDIATVKYRRSDGAILWGPRFYDGPAGAFDEGMAIALDAAENPVVAGTSVNFARTHDVVVLRYDSATGAQNGPPAVIDGVLGHDLPLHNLVVRGTSVVVAAEPFLTVAYQETDTLFCDPSFPPPVASVSSGPACQGQTVRLDVSGYPGAQYSWSGPGGFTSTQRNPTFVAGNSTAGVYSVTVRAYGCVLTAAARLVVGPELSPTITVSPGQAGEPGTASVPDAGPAATYFWIVTNGVVLGPNNLPSIRFSASGSAPVSLAVTVGNVNGCVAAGLANVGAPGPTPSPTPGGATPDAIPTLSEGLLGLFALALAAAGLFAMSPRTK